MAKNIFNEEVLKFAMANTYEQSRLPNAMELPMAIYIVLLPWQRKNMI